jgi:4-hydroxy 2-oxovalerate aldolase
MMFRPEIKVVDCTIRDGGLTNNSHFTLETVRAVYRAVCEAGVDYVELGYRNNKAMLAGQDFGPWRFCEEKQLRGVTEGIDPRTTKISLMMDSHKALPSDLLPKEQSVVDMIRVATYVKDVDKAIKLVNDATAKGYETTINIMAISKEGGRFLDEAVQQLETETKANAIYIVDSFGAMYSEEVHYLIERFSMYIKTKEIGVHFHNNQQLAFANTIEGIIKGANYVDGTLYGLGRAAGNCPLELLLGFLKNPKFSLLPILEVIGSHIIPLQQEIQWGYCIPHMLVGVLNRHPEASIRWMEGKNKHEYGEFYKKLTDEVQS